MNKYNPNIRHRRSIRLKGYDYTQAGLYFVTICVQNRRHLFGEIIDGKMIWNDAGKMVKKWYWELENKFTDKKCHEMVVMPNHFHCIIETITIPNATAVGADLRVCPDIPEQNTLGEHPNTLGEHPNTLGEPSDNLGEHTGSPLHRAVQWFKTMSTNEYIRGVKQLGWPPFNGKLWQRNYYEHIIRDERSYHRIAKYIIDNPVNWNGDKFYDL